MSFAEKIKTEKTNPQQAAQELLVLLADPDIQRYALSTFQNGRVVPIWDITPALTYIKGTVRGIAEGNITTAQNQLKEPLSNLQKLIIGRLMESNEMWAPLLDAHQKSDGHFRLEKHQPEGGVPYYQVFNLFGQSESLAFRCALDADAIAALEKKCDAFTAAVENVFAAGICAERGTTARPMKVSERKV